MHRFVVLLVGCIGLTHLAAQAGNAPESRVDSHWHGANVPTKVHAAALANGGPSRVAPAATIQRVYVPTPSAVAVGGSDAEHEAHQPGLWGTVASTTALAAFIYLKRRT